MATWLTHLRIAELLLNRGALDCPDYAEFYLGNIAPDSGEPHCDGYIPPKVISHFGHSVERDYERFIKEYMPSKTDGAYSFMLGYFVHLLADGIWVTVELESQRKKYEHIFPCKEAFYNELKKDLYTIDRQFISSHKGFEPIKQIAALGDFENKWFDYFKAEAFNIQTKRVTDSILSMRDGDYEYKYMVPETVEKYIDLAVGSIMDRLQFYGLI